MGRRIIWLVVGGWVLAVGCGRRPEGNGGEVEPAQQQEQDAGGEVVDAGPPYQDAGADAGAEDAGVDAGPVLLLGCPRPSVGSDDPQLPAVSLDSRFPTLTGKATTVSDPSALQAAIDSAQPGDTLLLTPGVEFRGHFVLRNKGGQDWIVIRSASNSLPPEGSRVSLAHASEMPGLVTPDGQPVLTAEPGASHYRLVGLDLHPDPNLDLNDLVVLGTGLETDLAELPHHLVIDRCLVRGDPTVGGKRGVRLNSAHTAILDSYFADWKRVGQDSQAIAGWNGPGPFLISGNYLEAAGENLLFGGADATIPQLIPADIEVCRNHFRKPLSWKADDPSFGGTQWMVKNLFELKVGRRVLLSANLLEQSWVQAQSGFAVMIKSVNQGGAQSWAVTEDVTLFQNVIRRAAGGVIIAAQENPDSLKTQRVRLSGNLFYQLGASWGLGVPLFKLVGGVDQVRIEHSTGVAEGSLLTADGVSQGFLFRDNLVTRGLLGFKGTGLAEGLSTLSTLFPGAVFEQNAIVGATSSLYPQDNFFPRDLAQVGFVDAASFDYRLSSQSPLKGQASDGADLGADLEAIRSLGWRLPGP